MVILRRLTRLGGLFMVCANLLAGCGGGGSQADAKPVQGQGFNYQRVENMASGFFVKGDHGYLQIDDTFFNLSLSAKGAVWLQDRATITVSGEMPMVCFRNLSQVVHIESVQKSGRNFTYNLRGIADQVGEQVTYYVFDRVPVVQKMGVAMLWNAQSQPTFNSDYPVMKVVSVTPLPASDPWNAPLVVSAPAGTYAACLAQPRVRAVPVDYGNMQYPVFAEGSRVSANGASTQLIRVASVGAPTDGFLAGGGALMLIDVAGL